jgi:hypothetical protein
MATTPNFSWPTPDNTDVVKNGALAIRTLGDAIDASLVDLEGGTTGQVLSKTSNTDMDFTWVTTDDANAIQNAIVDAKGDLIAASANDTPARLAVGSNDALLVAASGETTGLKWAGLWETFTPTLQNITLGNGTATGRYAKIGKTVFVYFNFVFGSTSSITSLPNFDLPITASRLIDNGPTWCNLKNAGTADDLGMVYLNNTKCYFQTINTAGTLATPTGVNATTPFTWTTNDQITAEFFYEVA